MPLAAPREVDKLIFKQASGDQIERCTLGGSVRRRGARGEPIEIFTPQLLCTGTALHPVAGEVACVQLVETRCRIATQQEPDEPETGQHYCDSLAEPRVYVFLQPGLKQA